VVVELVVVVEPVIAVLEEAVGLAGLAAGLALPALARHVLLLEEA
jgi:hypothetical protein